jgi:hypothetical protein
MMNTDLIKNWFGADFYKLHPLLQKLHLAGGVLSGDVHVSYGQGIAGLIGKRLAKKMNLPEPGVHSFTVAILHDHEGMHWNRCFGKTKEIKSIFKPVGYKEQGYWMERLGAITMKLTVDIHNGGWYWRCIGISIYGFPLPLWLSPRLHAYKLIEQELYYFHVAFSLPGLGVLVAYEGLLQAKYQS